MSLFTHTPHPHIARREDQGPVKTADSFRSFRHAGGVVGHFNETIARHGTLIFGTMWAFYAFMVYGALGAVFPKYQVGLLYWSNWIQLWSLPLLMVGAVVLGKAADVRAQQTYDDAAAILAESLQIQEHLQAQDLVIERQEALLLKLSESLQAQDAALAKLIEEVRIR